jgi:hypothetical protein
MNNKELTSLITNIASAIEANEKFALPIIAAKARREAQARLTDTSLITASQVLTKMASKHNFISKSELQEVVDRFGASHSKLATVFEEELGRRTTNAPALFSRDSQEGKSVEHDYKKLTDPVLSNALSSAFDKSPVAKIYSQDTAHRAERAVYAQLLAIGLEPKEITTFAGKEDIIICQASHETPKGYANTLIPVEIKEGKALLPTLFLSKEGFRDLEIKSYEQHILSVAGGSFKVDGEKLLNILDRVKNGEVEHTNVVELAAIKIASESGSPSFDPNSLYYKELEEPVLDIEIPKMSETEESKFASTLGKPDGIAKFIHGNKIVEAGRSMLTHKFSEMGYNYVQIKVADVDKDKIFYAVAIGTNAGFNVPIDIENGLVMSPKILFANNMVSAFNKTAIDDVIKSGDGGNKRALAVVSQCYDMKPSDLLNVVKESVEEGNYERAEDAINVLGETDPNTQKIAIAHMIMVLTENSNGSQENIKAMQKIASEKINDVPCLMNYKIFFPEGA